MDLRQQVCAICRQKDKNRRPTEPCFSAENDLDFGPSHVELGLPDLTRTEQLLIAKVHVFIQVRQVKGVQYRYREHTVSFARNIVKLYQGLPLIPEELEVIYLKPGNVGENPQFGRQHNRDLKVRRRRIEVWLESLR